MRTLTSTVVLTALSVSLGAQGTQANTPSTAAPAAADYGYRADGRRDPFTSLVASGTDPQVPGSRGAEGVAGFTVGEISVRGIMQSRGLLVAMVHGPDDKTYLIHQGDKLADGVVKNVTPQGLVVVQDVSDPLSVQKHREVRKLLRSLEDAK
jgi:Tfp pilus assembly protein PilP